jgi:hypothetical protein
MGSSPLTDLVVLFLWNYIPQLPRAEMKNLSERQAGLKLLKRLVEMTGYPETPEQEKEAREIADSLVLKSFRVMAIEEMMAQLNRVHAAAAKKQGKEVR